MASSTCLVFPHLSMISMSDLTSSPESPSWDATEIKFEVPSNDSKGYRIYKFYSISMCNVYIVMQSYLFIFRIVCMQLMPEANLTLWIVVSIRAHLMKKNKKRLLTLASASRPASLSLSTAMCSVTAFIYIVAFSFRCPVKAPPCLWGIWQTHCLPQSHQNYPRGVSAPAGACAGSFFFALITRRWRTNTPMQQMQGPKINNCAP